MCNVAISTLLLYCIVTIVRLALVTNKGYLLTYLVTYFYWNTAVDLLRLYTRQCWRLAKPEDANALIKIFFNAKQ